MVSFALTPMDFFSCFSLLLVLAAIIRGADVMASLLSVGMTWWVCFGWLCNVDFPVRR
jgi:hypothetical protein